MGREYAELIPHTGLISKVISLHINCLDLSWLTDSVISEFRNIQSCDAYSVRVHLDSFSSFTKNPRNARGNIHRTGYHLLSSSVTACASSFVIRVNLLHPYPSLFLYKLLLSLRCFSIVENYFLIKGNYVQNNSKYRTEVIF